jgi:secreted trypsin-like serine protease
MLQVLKCGTTALYERGVNAPHLMIALAALTAASTVSAAPKPAVINGTADSGDPAVVMFVSWDPSPAGYYDTCTAELIAPTVLITAAHCVDPSTHPNYNFGLFLQSDGTNFTFAGLSPVKSVAANPSYNATASTDDIGVILLAAPLPGITPLPFLHTADESAWVGQSARIIGYGRTNASDANSAYAKYQATTTVASLSASYIVVGDTSKHDCTGDSGGPALVTVNGVETIVGVNSIGPTNCTSASSFTRLDLVASWVESFIPASTNDAGVAPNDLATTTTSNNDAATTTGNDAGNSVNDLGAPSTKPVDASTGEGDTAGKPPSSSGCDFGGARSPRGVIVLASLAFLIVAFALRRRSRNSIACV